MSRRGVHQNSNRDGNVAMVLVLMMAGLFALVAAMVQPTRMNGLASQHHLDSRFARDHAAEWLRRHGSLGAHTIETSGTTYELLLEQDDPGIHAGLSVGGTRYQATLPTLPLAEHAGVSWQVVDSDSAYHRYPSP